MNKDFWLAYDDLVRNYPVMIDRPRGSRHPRFPHYVYPLDYGYLEGTSSGDGEGIDVWIGSQEQQVTGLLVVVDPEKKDTEIKVLLGCNESDKKLVLESSSRGTMQYMLIDRENL